MKHTGTGWRRIVSLVMVVAVMMSMMLPASAAATEKKFSIQTTESGAYNVTATNATALPRIYSTNIFGKETEVTNYTYKKSGSTYTIATYFEKNVKYYVYVPYSSTAPTCSYAKNLDRYSTSTTKLSQGKIWDYDPKGFQPNSAQGMYTRQICYLTTGEAAIYANQIDKSKYLKLIDTSVSVTAYLAFCEIPATSALGKFITKIGKDKYAQIGKLVLAGITSWTLIPSLADSAKNAVETATNNYNNGLKITVTNATGGYYNSYASWNERANTVVGPEYARGTFTTYTRDKFVGPY